MSNERWLTLWVANARRRASELQAHSARLRAESDSLMQEAEDLRCSASALPQCPACAFDETKPALRTELVQYYRCPRCGYIWSRRHSEADSTPITA